MFGIRNARLLPLALLVAVAFLYIGWYRPLAWYPATASTGPDISRLPSSGTDKHAHHGSPPAGAADPTSQETKDDASYDFKRPTTADEAGYPADAPPVKNPPVINNGPPVGKPNDQTVPPVAAAPPKTSCPAFERYMSGKPGPASTGFRKFPNLRPPPECRSFRVPAVDAYIEKMRDTIQDPDLYRLFENSFPNTLDTMVKWHGFAQDQNGNDTDEELSYIITGDIDAMWLRDSASQLYSYLPFLAPHDPEGGSGSGVMSLNSLWRGLINSHSRYIIISPYCHSFQPPPESGIPPTLNGAYKQNNPRPAYDPKKVFDCKWELDSLASFLQVSVGYWTHTHDLAFFARHNWIEAVKAAVDAAGAMRLGTYDKDGRVLPSAWTFTGWTNRGSETLTNDGLGNPSRENGMVRSAFRPSDDATIFQFLVPANMMWAKYLEEASALMEELAEGAVHEINAAKQAMARDLVQPMRDFALGIRRGIHRDAIVSHRDYGEIFAYECDGFGGVNLMDDANVPSLLSMPLFGYASSRFPLPSEVSESERDYHEIYQNTRQFALSLDNPYYAKGPALSAVGGPHLGPGRAWPMAALVAGLTAFDAESGYVDSRGTAPLTVGKGLMLEDHVAEQLGMVLNSTSGWGIVHESVNSWNGVAFSRAWFGWANGLLGELVVRLEKWESAQKSSSGQGGLLARSWQ